MNFWEKILLAIFTIFMSWWLLIALNSKSHVIDIPKTDANTPVIQVKNVPKQCVKNPKISTFMYHYIRDDEVHDNPATRNLSVTPANFRAHMEIVSRLAKEQEISLMNGADFADAFQKDCFPAENIWIFTSDDGWKDNATYLLPIASEYKVPFIFGIISGKVGAKWFVSHEELMQIVNNPLMTVASHTVNHKALSTINSADEHFEICESKKQLEAMTGKTVNMFIYPTGRIWKESTKYLKECGYALAWSTNFGKNLDWNHVEGYIMNRVRINHDTSPYFYEKLAK